MGISPEAIAIIPALYLEKIHFILFAQYLHFPLRKSCKSSQGAGICHGKFIKHIQGGMRTILLDWQYTRHIGKGDITLILQEIAYKVKINLLSLCIIPIFTENTVPFIYNKNKRVRCFSAS